jgi:hypothetical protein
VASKPHKSALENILGAGQLFCTKIRRPIYVNRFVGRYRLMV